MQLTLLSLADGWTFVSAKSWECKIVCFPPTHTTIVGSLQGFANDVFAAAYNITTDADSALGIFDDLVLILNVDVNVSGMTSDVTVSCCYAFAAVSTVLDLNFLCARLCLA